LKRTIACFDITGNTIIKEQMLHWINRFSICSFLDNHLYPSTHHKAECLAAAGAIRNFTGKNTLNSIDAFYAQEQDWLFGHINYEFAENNENNQQDTSLIGFDTIAFFQPETVLRLESNQLFIETIHHSAEKIFNEIVLTNLPEIIKSNAIKIEPSIKRADYIHKIHQLLNHIHRGDCYEINFCQAFIANEVNLDPIQTYINLTNISPNPFSCYYKQNNAHLLCASPERYLQKKDSQLISQPIKGTSKRNLENTAIDEQLKEQLLKSEKERSENVMVVDLVRNDLSKICKEGTVEVEELFGIYSFPQVHQMISTIKGTLKEHTLFSSIIHASFPMGSMTGAPKKRVMDLIKQYELGTRGIFSGAVGYINPDQDFDFNVVIRSILYNSSNKHLCYFVGSGITANSKPAEEYEECLLKAKAMNQVLGN
jgi:para-aminobenzoate synthetase component I